MVDTQERVVLLILGKEEVGKTCLCTRFLHDKFSSSYNPSSFLSFYKKKFTIGSVRILITLYDVECKYTSLDSDFIKMADGVIYLYSMDSLDSFLYIQSLLESNTFKDKEMFIVGNHKDDLTPSVSSNGDFKTFRNSIDIPFMEVNVKSGENVQDVFKDVLMSILKKRNIPLALPIKSARNIVN